MAQGDRPARMIGVGEELPMRALLRTAMVAVLLATQAGCMTNKLLEWGGGEPQPARAAIEQQPAAYTRAERLGRWILLKYDTTVNADGAVRKGSTATFDVDMAKLSWTGPRDANCSWENASFIARPDVPWIADVPLVERPSNDIQAVIAIHKQHAKGPQPLSVQTSGLDVWIVCGAEDEVSYARAPVPPPPRHGQEGGRTAEQVVTTIVLLPFAVVLDVLGGALYVVSAVMHLFSGGPWK